ncbi:hypothetical protein [Granulicella sibirica]|uniref:Uncharacterized protein n=1 Tax=Granulicella sibirica TaxID=2479048 RepID=A0A4Q0T556_9BACT|nr:hypothetical protein [Granulicella sibirica]RXH56691.1 hypothetical protein GRAN_3548 [Granulicella sibirica]
MNTLTTFLATMLGISIAVERVIEILKGWLTNFWLFKTNPDSAKEAQRIAFIHVLSGICGALIAACGKLTVLPNVPADSWLSWMIAGLLASGGSAFWNHALDLVKATKVTSEQGAIAAVNVNEKQNLLVEAHPASFARTMDAGSSSSVWQQEAIASSLCVVKVDPDTGSYKAPAKQSFALKLQVTSGSFNFVPSQCTAQDASGKDVPLSGVTANRLVFPASPADSYKLLIAYEFSPGSEAELSEDCVRAVVLDYVDGTVAVPRIYTIQIS